MNTIKKGALLFLFTVLLAAAVFSQDFKVEVTPIENTINFGQLATYTLTIWNDLETRETFRVKILDYPTWEIKTEPILNPIQFTIDPGKKREVKLFLNPLHVSTYGVYDINLITEIVSLKEKQETPLRVNLVSSQAGTYVETVLVGIIMDENIDPTKEIPLAITLNNQNIIEYPELLVTLESNLIKESLKESLNKKEKKTLTLTEMLSPQTPPQEDTLVAKIISNNKTLDTEIKKFNIIEHREITRKEVAKTGFLKVTNEITLENVGNVQYTENIKIESSLMQMLFTSSKPKGQFTKEGQKRYLNIPVDIAPGATFTIQLTKNYITLLILLVLLALIVGLYYLFRSPLTIRKTSANVSYQEGGVSELKVILNVSNRSKRKLKDIEIIDRIPNIANLEKGLTIGTLHPSKILKHEKKGTLIKWLIDELDAGDERVISYKIKSHLSILGEFSLSPTIARFKFKGKEVVSHSNSLGVNP
jgi:hypothetical protein